ncbi:hypothetical protein BDV93DRAFT_563670 [Ceratobasidium sp. AG-I]|nr:hypothetical protein BDV93DRAFT_563670 [Ceratobasidium sp. AG-I]
MGARSNSVVAAAPKGLPLPAGNVGLINPPATGEPTRRQPNRSLREPSASPALRSLWGIPLVQHNDSQ